MVSKYSKKLTQKDIEEILNAYDSEAEFADNDSENEEMKNTEPEPKNDFININTQRQSNLLDIVMSNADDFIVNDELEIENETFNNSSTPVVMQVPQLNEITEIDFVDEFEQYVVTEKKNIEFRRREFDKEKFVFELDIDTDTEQNSLCTKTPLSYFEKYIPLEMYERMATYTNIYAEQKAISVRSFKHTNSAEMMQFIGIHMLMGVMKLPQIKMYWSKNLQIESVASVMSCERFYQLRTNFHLADNLKIISDCKDKFVKSRPLIESIRKRCKEVSVEENISIDEQIIPFTGHLNVKQYIKGKPCPWGIKVYMLCGKSGYPYDFVLYQGSNTEISSFDTSRFGHGAATVLHLIKRISRVGHNLYMDNYFTTYQLLEILQQRKINATGTIRINRFNKPSFISDVELKKQGRGSSDQLTSRDGKIILVKWQDNKAVYLASNYVGKSDEREVRRFDKKNKTYIIIMQPYIVHLYNFGMGGVDLLDQMISYYRIFIKSRKWPLRIIFHFINVAICASWIEYRQESIKTNVPTKNIMPLIDFTQLLGRSLTAVNNINRRKRGRPSHELENSANCPSTSKFVRGEVRPLKEIQYDEHNHLPQHDDAKEATRCKNFNCSGRTRIMCQKCKIHLCLSKDRNCFSTFHTK